MNKKKILMVSILIGLTLISTASMVSAKKDKGGDDDPAVPPIDYVDPWDDLPIPIPDIYPPPKYPPILPPFPPII